MRVKGEPHHLLDLATPYLSDPDVTLYCGDALETLRWLPAGSVQCCVTSPPYWGLRDYGVDGQLGLEATPEAYVAAMVEVFREVRRVLAGDGTLWLNLGDSYASSPPGNKGTPDEAYASSGLAGARAGSRYMETLASSVGTKRNTVVGDLKPKDLVGIPWRVAFALQADGWYLRSDIVWSKPNPMPESVTDRPTKSHEYVFLLSKSPRYFYDAAAISEPAAWERWGDQTYSPEAEAMYGSRVKARGKNELLGKRTYDGFNERWNESERNGVAKDTRNARSVWEIATQPYPEAHFATYPEELVRRCILAGSRPGDTILDPFAGSGTTGLIARKHERCAILIELNGAYCTLAAKRLQQLSLLA